MQQLTYLCGGDRGAVKNLLRGTPRDRSRQSLRPVVRRHGVDPAPQTAQSMAFVGKLFIDPATQPQYDLDKCLTWNHTAGGGGHAHNCSSANKTCLAGQFGDIMDGGKLPDDGFGIVQLLFLMAAYGYILFSGANLIGDGAELLLLVPSMAGIVGTLVLPILGAVPDGAMVLFSGLGADAQQQLSVGMGALAGSTIMLLTIPWFLSILAGRVDLDESGEAIYKVPKGQRKLTPGRGLRQSGVSTEKAVSVSCRLMILTCLSYVVIQGPAMQNVKLDTSTVNQPPENFHEKTVSLVAMILCLLLFVAVCVYQVYAGGEEQQDVVDMQVARQQGKALETGATSLQMSGRMALAGWHSRHTN
jgi:hypothetical protein